MTDPLAMSGTAAAIRASLFADLAPRIEARLRDGGDLVALHIGDTYIEPPASARFSHVDETAFDSAVYRYGPIGGLASLKEALVARLRLRDVGPHVVAPGRNVLVACGATHAIFCGARAVLDPGDEVLVAAPYWPLAVGIVRAVGAVPIEVPLTAQLYADPSVDVASLLDERATARTRAIYLITPNNPDGKVLSPRQLGAIARFAIARGLWVIADEVYADYVYDGQHTSIARLEGMAEQTLSAYSLSKSDALAGTRIGFLVAPERVVDLATRVATHTVFNVPVASQRVALRALSAPASWIDDARCDYRAARDATIRAFDGSGVRMHIPEGGSYVFADFAPVLGARPLRDLLERAIDRGVLVAPGEGFGDGFGSYARICFTSVSRPRLIEGVARLREALDDVVGRTR